MAATVKWRLEGKWVKNCNCAPGCPCDFWAPPTHHSCQGMFCMKVDKGSFGTIKMDGVKFGVVLHFPGPLHEGNGTVQPFIDAKAKPAQREAVLQILSGKAGNPWFEVVSSLVSTLHPPHIAPVHFEMDLKKRKAAVRVEGLLETVTEPIRNLATGAVHTIRVELPEGMEYKRAETAVAKVLKATGPVAYEWSGGHSSLATVVQTERGLVR
jgi:hypothetical protein